MAKATRAEGWQRALRVLCVILLMALLAGILATEINRNISATGNELATPRTLAHTDRLVGYVFREEQALNSYNNGPVEYLVANGDTVSAEQTLANVYGDNTGAGKRQQAAKLYEEIARLERALAGEVTQKEYWTAYTATTAAFGAGNLANGLSGVRELSEYLAKAGVTAENEAAVRADVATLRAQVEELLRYESKQDITANVNGRFYYTADGYEAVFGTASVAGLTPKGLQDLLAGRQSNPGVIGKLVVTGPFYLVLPTTREIAAGYREGQAYTVRFSDGVSAELMLEKITLSDGDALLTLRGEQMPEGMDVSRRLSLEIVRATSTGLAVPCAALREENGVVGVYVSVDGVARFRRVAIVAEEHGCCLVEPREEEGYLAGGEKILITLRRLYDGKVLR